MIEIVKGPYLQWPTPSSMTIMWETSAPSDSRVTTWETARIHSGRNGGYVSVESTERITTAEAQVTIHRITLEGLQPETNYHYRVQSGDAGGNIIASEVYPFKTAVQRGTPFSFTVTSEMGGAGSPLPLVEAIFDQMARYRPDFVLLVGDAVNHGMDYADWQRTLFDPGKNLFTHTPFYLCLGNHEEQSEWYYRFTGYPAPANYYSFDYGNTRFAALDSTALISYEGYREGLADVPDQPVTMQPGMPQYNFLTERMSSPDPLWKIVFFHYPPYVSGDYQVTQMRQLSPALENCGVDLVFNSHTIVYERSHPLRDNRIDFDHGVRYLVVGGAGSRPWFHHKRAWHTAQALSVPHFVHVVIAADTLELRAIDFEGRLFDVLLLRTHPKHP